MTDVEPPTRSHRPFVAVALLIAIFLIAAGSILVAKRSGLSATHSFSLLTRLSTLSAKTRFSIDAVTIGKRTLIVTGVQPKIVIAAGTPVSVRGWAVDDGAGAPAKGVNLYVDGTQRIVAEYGIKRDDVAKALHDPNLEASGFNAIVDTSDLGSGSHELTFEILRANGSGVYHIPERLQFTVLQN